MDRKKTSGAPMVTAKQIAFCLENLHDGAALRRSTLIELPIVVAIANERYRGQYWGRSSALRDVLIEACRRLEAGVNGNVRRRRLVAFLKLYCAETDIREIARQLGVHRSTIYRYVMPPAIALLADEVGRDSTRQHATQIA
jgi:hypothetical protein